MRLAQAACKTTAAKQALVGFVTELLKDHGPLAEGALRLDDDERDEDAELVLAGTADQQELARIAHLGAIVQLAGAVIDDGVFLTAPPCCVRSTFSRLTT